MRKIFAALPIIAGLLLPQAAWATNCYIREYQTIATIGTTWAEIAPEAGTAIDQTPVAIGGSSASSAAFNANTHMVRLFCGASASFVFGASPTATTSERADRGTDAGIFRGGSGPVCRLHLERHPMKRVAIVAALLLALAGAAHGFGLGLGNRFGKLGAGSAAKTASSPPAGLAMSFLPANNTSTPAVNVLQRPALNFERTQAWTAVAKINLATPPTASTAPAAIIFTTCNQGSNPNLGAFTGYEFWIDSTGRLRVRIISNFIANNYIGIIGTTNVAAGVPHTVAASYDGSSTVAGVKIYVDGVLETMTSEGTSLTASIIQSPAQAFMVGNQTGFPFSFGGTIAEFLLTKEILTQSQIAAYTTAAAAVDANTAVAFDFSENSGAATADLSANGFTGFVQNAKWQSGSVGNAPFPVASSHLTPTGTTAFQSASFTIPAPASGDALFVTVDIAASPNTLGVTVTDNQSNNYTLVHQNTQFSGVIFATFFCANITNAPTTIIATLAGSSPGTFWTVNSDEFANIKAITSPLDGFSDAFNATSPATTNAVTSGSFTTTGNFDLIYSSGVDYSNAVGGPGFLPGTNFVRLQPSQNTGNGFIDSQYSIQQRAGSIAATATVGAVSETHLAGFGMLNK